MRNSALRKFKESQLMLALYNELPVDYFKLNAHQKAIVISATMDLDEDPVNWNEAQRLAMHGILLEDSLAVLGDSRNAAEKLDVLCWIFTDSDARDKEFSFDVCCRVYGADPDEIRNRIEHDLAELKPGAARKWLSKMMAGLTKARHRFKELGAMSLAG